MEQFNSRYVIALLTVCVMLLCEILDNGRWWELHFFWLMAVCFLFAAAPWLAERWTRRRVDR